MAVDSNEIGIPIEPDFTGFAQAMSSGLRSLTNFNVSVDLKPNVKNLKSQISKEIKALGGDISIPIKLDLPKSSITQVKANIKKAFSQEFKVGTETYKLPLPIDIDARFSERSLRELKKDVNNVFKRLTTDTTGKAVKVAVPIDLKVQFTSSSLNQLKADVNKVFTKTITGSSGKITRVAVPISLKAEFTSSSLNQMKKDVNNIFKKTIVDDAGNAKKVTVPMKLATELVMPKNALEIKRRIEQQVGPIKVQVGTGSAGTASAVRETRNLTNVTKGLTTSWRIS